MRCHLGTRRELKVSFINIEFVAGLLQETDYTKIYIHHTPFTVKRYRGLRYPIGEDEPPIQMPGAKSPPIENYPTATAS